MEIDDAVEFFNAYLDAEYAEGVAARSEPDEVLDERREASESFMHAVPGAIMSSVIGRGPGWSTEKLAEYAQTVNQVARRVMFLVAEYRCPAWGRIFGGYASGPRPRITGSYGQLLYAAEVEGRLKIIAQYAPEILEPAPPMRWSHAQGAEIGKLGRPVALRVLAEPTLEEHRQDWLAICESMA